MEKHLNGSCDQQWPISIDLHAQLSFPFQVEDLQCVIFWAWELNGIC